MAKLFLHKLSVLKSFTSSQTHTHARVFTKLTSVTKGPFTLHVKLNSICINFISSKRIGKYSDINLQRNSNIYCPKVECFIKTFCKSKWWKVKEQFTLIYILKYLECFQTQDITFIFSLGLTLFQLIQEEHAAFGQA